MKERVLFNINVGDYFIVNGQMLFVESIGDQEVVVNKKGTATKKCQDEGDI